MTSYMYNPSQKVTEILSKFLEFDPAQLELGIWSGDLSLKNVNLRQDAIYPLLNKKANKPHLDPRKKAPLHMKLVSGTVGQMRIRIPWKRLMWGSGAVQLDISDVMIVLALQSREEAEAQKKAEGPDLKSESKKKDSKKSGYSKSYREAKQRRLRETERRHLQGLPVALWLESIHRKRSIKKDAAKAEAAEKQQSTKLSGDNRVERWMKHATSDFFWRFCTGLQGSVKKARIVVVQDGVEIGCIIHSIEIVAGKEEAKMSFVMGDESVDGDSEISSPVDTDLAPPAELVYEGVHDDGEHLDKVIKQEGAGIFIRKEASMANVPQTLRFSNSVSADDYVLRPVNLEIAFSVFYPHPPERRKKRAADNQSLETNPTTSTAASTAVASTSASVSDSATNASSKRRRGKRDRDRVSSSAPLSDDVTASPSGGTKTASLSSGSNHGSGRYHRVSSHSSLSGDHSQRLHRSYRRLKADGDSSGGRQRLRRYVSVRSMKSGSVTYMKVDDSSVGVTDAHSVAAQSAAAQSAAIHSVAPQRPEQPVPQLDCHVGFEDIQVVFSTRHYELLNYVLSTIARMKNGRPDRTIWSVRESDPAAWHRKVTVDHPVSPSSEKRPMKSAKATLTTLLAPLANFRQGAGDNEQKSPSKRNQSLVQLQLLPDGTHSARTEIISKWWTYAIGAVLWEIRKRKSLTTNFREMYISFDWGRQRYKRQEYIDLYIALRLESRSQDGNIFHIDDETREQELLQIEDELPLEQILLYRSIARSIRVRGITKMPSTIHELHIKMGVQTPAMKSRRSSLASPISDKMTLRTPNSFSRANEPGQGSTLLSLLQEKFDFAQKMRFQDGLKGVSKMARSLATAKSNGSSTHGFVTPSGRQSRKSSIGFDSSVRSESGGRMNRKGSIGFDSSSKAHRRPTSFDNASTDFQAGNFYATATKTKDSVADGRTVRSVQVKGKSSKQGTTTGSSYESVVPEVDGMMKITFSIRVKSIDLMVVEEEYIFDLSPEEFKVNAMNRRLSPNAMSLDYGSGEDSSSDDVSDLSVLTDDQRFFNEQDPMSAEAEEEEDEEGARLSSTDFLMFGLPENLLLRMTIAPVAGSIRGRSGGPKTISLSVGRVVAVGEGDKPLFSIGPFEPSTPVSEVSLDPYHSRRFHDSEDAFEMSSSRRNASMGHGVTDQKKKNSTDFKTEARRRKSAPDDLLSVHTKSRSTTRAIQLTYMTDRKNKEIIQCDLSKIAVTIDLRLVAKLIQFYLKSEIRYPNKIIAKSSREVARKFMVHKSSRVSNIWRVSTAIHVNGLEVRIPFDGGDGASEASELQSSTSSEESVPMQRVTNSYHRVAVLAADTFDLYSGSAVDDIAAYDAGQRSNSSLSWSVHSKKSFGKTVEMLDVADLTSTHDPFSCHHWVAAMGGINYVMDAALPDTPRLTEIPVDVEILLTVNETSMLETASPRHQVVLEVSPVHVLLSRARLDMLSRALSAVDLSLLDGSSKLKKRRPDPPRIEILSSRVLHSIDVSFRRVRVALAKDCEPTQPLTLQLKETVMEECISDFLSVVSCFDFSLPNEEALSSAMQICIGRLVGLGLSDDEAWGCTNAARLNFLDDIALMRRAQSDVLVQLSSSIKQDSEMMVVTEGDSESSFEIMDSVVNSKVSQTGSSEDETDDESDDDSADSAEIVETTLNNAVEKTIATFSPLLLEDNPTVKHIDPILVLDLPLGARVSMVKLFYDKHLTSCVPSLVVTNSAGIEVLTLVPSSTTNDSTGSFETEDEQEGLPGHGIVFSRFDLDDKYGFGRGGLPMSVLGSDAGEDDDSNHRNRKRLDDIEIGEIELLFSSNVYEEIIDELSKLRRKKTDDNSMHSHKSPQPKTRARSNIVETSCVVSASCASMLMTSDQLVPFSRLTLEEVAFKNKKALAFDSSQDSPSFAIIADSLTLQNLTPEGQFYPDVIGLLSPKTTTGMAVTLLFFKSPDPWKFSTRLEIDFRGFRVYLLRQFIYELLHFFVSERYAFGRLKKKYSSDVRDIFGNQKPPLLWSIKVFDSSVICPRCSSSSDMVAFEVEEALIALSYQPESFAMPTESSPFEASPSPKQSFETKQGSQDGGSRRSSFRSYTDYHDCMDESPDQSDISHEPISSFDRNWKKRLTINLQKIRVFSAMAPDCTMREMIESPLFRFFHGVDGRADAGKLVYAKLPEVERHPSVNSESLIDTDKCEQRWEELSSNILNLEILADYAPHLRLLIADRGSGLPFSLNAKMSQFCLLLSVWYSNMQELPSMFPFVTSQVQESAKPPTIPEDFPKYGTEEFVSLLETLPKIKSEICVMFKTVQLRCTFDPPGHFPIDPDCFQYFADPACPDNEKPGMVITISDLVAHIVGDFLNIKRIGVGASTFDLIDERRRTTFSRVLSVRPFVPPHVGSAATKGRPAAWADITWGLRNDVRTLSSSLPLPVQITVYMTPGWSTINVGVDYADGVMFELSWIWVFLDYFKCYFKEGEYGNPGHAAERWVHKLKNSLRKSSGQEPVKFTPPPGIHVDFRLWLCKPMLCVPSDYQDQQAPCLRIESRTGLWYRYKAIDEFSSQEVVTTDLNLFFANEFQPPGACRRQDSHGSISGTRPLIEGLSFGLRYDCNNAQNHKDISVRLPFVGDKDPSCAISGRQMQVQPVVLASPTVCTPIEQPTRILGHKVCEITCIIEVLPITISTLMNFFRGPPEINEQYAPVEEDQGPPTFSASATIGDLRVYAIDPVLGVQLPVAVVSVSLVELTASKFTQEAVALSLKRSESPPEDLQVTVDCHLWADYFKLGITRSWEPLLEPFKCLLLFEKSKKRGQGFSLNADSPFQINLSGALLQVLGETVDSFSQMIGETFGEQATSGLDSTRSLSNISPSRNREGGFVEECIKTDMGGDVTVLHEIPKRLKADDRVAFSLRNLTGQKIRIHQQTDLTSESDYQKPAIVTYLNQVESMGLTFAATISVVKNFSIVEVPYPGLPHSRSGNQNHGSLKHAVDVQVPGFRWIQGIKVDTFGRKFETLTPKNTDICAKILRDWRLKNAMMLLTEVGLESGGRLVTVRSLFEVRNNATHPIKIVFNPDPRYRPRMERTRGLHLGSPVENEEDTVTEASTVGHVLSADEVEVVEPGEVFQIPTLLLEMALQMHGSHLGCLWLCPDVRDGNSSFLRSFHTGGSNQDDLDVSFCTRPVQLAKIVHESAMLFQSGSGEDVPVDKAKSGVQVSCTTRGGNGDGHAPFCYAIEVGRSPIVASSLDKPRDMDPSKDLLQASQASAEKKQNTASGSEKKMKKSEKIHGPVAYSLTIHAPLVIVNLLPEGGRFELMHAIRRTVLWYADLEPGQQIPVHSVGLDAPLRLLVNLGFCRTPVGEGALVHHGSDAASSGKDQSVGFKSIGKVVTKGTKQIGKTLTAMSDSPDKRNKGLLNQIQHHQFPRDNRKDRLRQSNVTSGNALGLDTGVGGIEDVDGKVHSVESLTYSPSDVDSETTVVDGVGQRLTLHIENVRGGGGQRRVSLFCPFWIVNTTEHSLRYRQEKSKSYVSGTVISPMKDGSRPVDGSNRNYQSRHKAQSSSHQNPTESAATMKAPMNTGKIFSGTPGALATAPGKCDLPASELAQMIDKDVPLEKLASIAFMFNFHEDVLSIGHQMLSVQLYDGTGQSMYVSDWSRGFSLDSVGFSQIVGMHCREGRTLELSVVVNVAPGFLSGYTKIVRFLPRYVVFNSLDRPIRLWQDSSVFRQVGEDRAVAAPGASDQTRDSRKWRFGLEEKLQHDKINQYESLYGRPATLGERQVDSIPEGTTAHQSALYIASVGPSELIPFHLPDSRGERQLRVDLGGTLNITSSFASDFPGEHTLKVSRAVDQRLLNHVSTRAAPKYKIVLPPPDHAGIGEWDGELGVYFETDWGGDGRIVVKGTKRGKYAFNHTDIHVGDELLRIDGVSVFRMTFSETMKLLKERLAYIALTKQQKVEQPKRGLRRLSIANTLKARRHSISYQKPGAKEESTAPKKTQLTLTFRTLEERLRKLRAKAAMESVEDEAAVQKGVYRVGMEKSASQRSIDVASDRPSVNSTSMVPTEPVADINVEMKSLHNTMFVILRPQDPENPPFRIQNRSINHIIFYRQRGCEGHPWSCLKPGESMPYSWEEPMKTKKLTVRVGTNPQEIFKIDCQASSIHESMSDFGAEFADSENNATTELERRMARTAKLKQALAYQFVDSEERGGYGPSITVRLEEIGYRNFLPISSRDGRNLQKKCGYLNCEVDTDGGTRLLVISDDTGFEDERGALNRHLETLRKQISYEQERISNLHSLRFVLSQPLPKPVPKKGGEGSNSTDRTEDRSMNVPSHEAEATRLSLIEADAKRLLEDYPEETTITSRHQVVVEVLEAVGLNPSDFIGSCNPYCEVVLKGRSKSRKYFFQKRRNKRKTYYIEKNLSPKWSDQIFIFDVPQEAVRVTRGHSIQVKVRNFRVVGQHPVLGQAGVHLGSVLDQRELEGWYPLAGRTGRRDVESAPISDVGRGSIKLRVQWVYTISALIDYFVLLSERRLKELTRSRKGMKEQLAHAIESDQRKREARDPISTARIQKLAPLQKKQQQKAQRSANKESDRDNMVGKLNQGLNTRLSLLKETLKVSRDRYLYALNFQTVESRRSRLVEQESHLSTGEIEGMDSSNALLPMTTESKSPNSTKGPAPSVQNFDTLVSPPRNELYPSPRRVSMRSGAPELYISNLKQGVDNVNPETGLAGTVALTNGQPPVSRLSRRSSLVSVISHRKLSLDVDETLHDNDQSYDQWQPSLRQGQAIYDGLVSQSAEYGISDLISVGTDADEEARRKSVMDYLLREGFVFHHSGEYFHVDHLPHHCRRSLFASSMGDRKSILFYRPRWYVGSPSSVRHFKSWQAAQAVYNDLELDVTRGDTNFAVQLKHESPSTVNTAVDGLESKVVISEKLMVPDHSPKVMSDCARSQVDAFFLSRNRFERACKRALSSVLNPGGWLTIRPITALNLPDTYTGMFVKLRYGSEVLVSETVDAKVTPRWSSPDFEEAAGGETNSGSQRFSLVPPRDRFQFTENDLHVHVEPQQTSGSIKISVVAERLNTKTELGVLHLPLGAAISSCIDCAEDFLDSGGEAASSDPPMYVRWFPLMSPRDVVPVEGDMGLSSRPKESEKLRDNMFQQYFAPCIQLALIWWPDSSESQEKEAEDVSSLRLSSAAVATIGPSGSSHSRDTLTDTPMIENYFNADIGRISAALIDSQRAVELLSFSAVDLDVRYSVTKTKTRVELVVGWIQLDHQDNRAREPVVLAPTPVEHIQPTLQILAVKDNLRTKSNIVSYEYVGVALQEMDLTVEESWIFDLWDFFMGIMRRRQAKKTVKGQRRADVLLANENCFAASDSEEVIASPTLLSIVEEGAEGGSTSTKRKIYVEQLILGLVKVNLSYIKGKKQSWELTDEGARALKKNLDVKELPTITLAAGGINLGNLSRNDQSEVFVRWSQHTSDEEVLAENGGTMSYNLPGLIAAVFPSVSDAPIRLQGKAIDHVFESPAEILSSIKNFYVNETLKQVYKIIGSLDFVGNPTIIFSSFVSGVRDLVVAPTSAFLKSPTDVNQVGIGVAKGAISLFSHSFSGIFGFAAKMSATAGQAAAILSLDTEYRQWHRDTVFTEATNLHRVWKRRGTQSVSDMITRPVGDVLVGVAKGTTGFFTSPYKGLMKGGKWGLLQGVAVGTVGVVAKPLVGFLDALTHFTASVHDIAKSVNILERRYQPALKLRLPYTHGPMSILSPFDPVASRSVYLLKLFPRKATRGSQRRGEAARWKEIHVASEVLHMEPGVETYAIATTVRVVLIKLKKETSGALSPSFCWEVDLTGRGAVSSRVSDHGHNGVALSITKRAKNEKSDEIVLNLRDAKDNMSTTELSFPNEPVRNYNISSSRSVDSGFSTEDDVAAFEYLGSDTIQQSSRGAISDPHADSESSYHKHGATTKGGQILEWFTVLAEYQHRRQLTKLHNAISCIVGDFNSLVFEGGDAPCRNSEGVTAFGLFEFDSDIPDEQGALTANTELVAALEKLPWMHEDVFKKNQGKSNFEQRACVSKLRESWVFSSDLKASMALGGPSWLIEARARAMFVAAEPPAIPEFLDPYDSVVVEVLSQLNQGNISREQATEILNSHEEISLSDSDDDFSHGMDQASFEEDMLTSRMSRPQSPGSGDEIVTDSEKVQGRWVSGSRTSQFHSANMSSGSEHSAEMFYSTNNFDVSVQEQPIDSVGTRPLEMAAASDQVPEQLMDEVVSTGPSMTDSLVDLEDCISSLGVEKKQIHRTRLGSECNSEELGLAEAKSFGNEHTYASTCDSITPSEVVMQQSGMEPDTKQQSSTHAGTRIGRMESLMEQLVILNASQMQRSTVPAEILGESPHSAASAVGVTNNLRSEVAELRAQVQVRTREDEALRNEISALRQQLAERRKFTSPVKEVPMKEADDAQSTGKLTKLRDMLRFGGPQRPIAESRGRSGGRMSRRGSAESRPGSDTVSIVSSRKGSPEKGITVRMNSGSDHKSSRPASAVSRTSRVAARRRGSGDSQQRKGHFFEGGRAVRRGSGDSQQRKGFFFEGGRAVRRGSGDSQQRKGNFVEGGRPVRRGSGESHQRVNARISQVQHH